jgi:putative FmdB family regulatory protein
MPTYDYACEACGHRIEVLHGVHAGGPAACPRCGGPMRKLLSPPTIVFKGSGWAKNDARAARPATGKRDEASGGGRAGRTSPGEAGTSKGEGTKAAAAD